VEKPLGSSKVFQRNSSGSAFFYALVAGDSRPSTVLATLARRKSRPSALAIWRRISSPPSGVSVFFYAQYRVIPRFIRRDL